MTIPTLLTWLRIFLIPIFAIAYYLPIPHQHFIAASIFFLAGATDWLDGFLARKLQQASKFGAFLDPIADKLLVGVSLVFLTGTHGNAWLAIPAAIIVGREILVSGLREWMAENGNRNKISVSYVGKVKTFCQMLAIFILLLFPPESVRWMVNIGLLSLYIAVMLTLWSLVGYMRIAWSEFRD